MCKKLELSGSALSSGFLARGCLFFNNLEEVSYAMEVVVVWLGLDCMYRLLPLSSMAMGATQALKSSLELKSLGVTSRAQGYRIKH